MNTILENIYFALNLLYFKYFKDKYTLLKDIFILYWLSTRAIIKCFPSKWSVLHPGIIALLKVIDTCTCILRKLHFMPILHHELNLHIKYVI